MSKRKTRVKFRVTGSINIQIGYLVKNKNLKNDYSVISSNGKSRFAIGVLDILEKI